jgi:hypothetical protein
MTRAFILSFAAAGLLLGGATRALADRAPTAEEQAAIEMALRAEGFTAWEEIEFDDEAWEVDDAVAADGTKYDLKLDRDYRILDREKD